MAWYDFLFEAIGRIRLADIKVTYTQIIFGNDTKFDLTDNYFGPKNGEKVKVLQTDEGLIFTLPNGTTLRKLIQDKSKNIEYLDKDKKVFTRADIGSIQVPFLSIEEEHERLIKFLKPYLTDYRQNLDLGGLLIASSIIRLEDSRGDKEIISKYYRDLHLCGKVGHMIYNLFRSGILEKEIIPSLQKIIETYDSPEEIKRQFLTSWYAIISIGYPTAYFANDSDSRQDFYKEIHWRFDRGEKKITVYSRHSGRNTKVKKWLDRLKRKKEILLKPSKVYTIGYSKAIKFEVTKR